MRGFPAPRKRRRTCLTQKIWLRNYVAFLCEASAWIGFTVEGIVRVLLLAHVKPGFVLIANRRAHHRAQHQNHSRANHYRSYDHARYAASRMPMRNSVILRNAPATGVSFWEPLWRPLYSLTRTSVFTTRFPAAMDLNSSGNRLSAHSPSTKSSARMTPASISSSARRMVRGV